MNCVYYIVGKVLENLSIGLTGGHGYTYDIEKPSKKKVQKNVPTTYGYYVNSDHQTEAVNIENYLTGRVSSKDINYSFLKHLELVLDKHINENEGKILIITNMPKLTKKFINGELIIENDKDYSLKVYNLYKNNTNRVIFDMTLYPKGGKGVSYAFSQLNIAELLLDIKPEGEISLSQLTEKEFSNPDIDLNPIVKASRWYFNTGDTSDYYDITPNGCRKYCFGYVDPKKSYYGKATPDVYYSILYTKKPITILDKLYDFSKENMNNELNRLFAGNLNNIKSKDVVRNINSLPGKFKGNELISPLTLGNREEPCLVEYLNPPGLAYRITAFMEILDDIYKAFLKRETNTKCKIRFDDITDYFLDFSGKKVKLKGDFTQATIKMIIPIEAPGCIKPVKLTLSLPYDCPDRNNFSNLIKSGVSDIKVYLVLDFNDSAGVKYCTIITTPEFDYIHSNSISNLRVYNLKELGR